MKFQIDPSKPVLIDNYISPILEGLIKAKPKVNDKMAEWFGEIKKVFTQSGIKQIDEAYAAGKSIEEVRRRLFEEAGELPEQIDMFLNVVKEFHSDFFIDIAKAKSERTGGDIDITLDMLILDFFRILEKKYSTTYFGSYVDYVGEINSHYFKLTELNYPKQIDDRYWEGELLDAISFGFEPTIQLDHHINEYFIEPHWEFLNFMKKYLRDGDSLICDIEKNGIKVVNTASNSHDECEVIGLFECHVNSTCQIFNILKFRTDGSKPEFNGGVFKPYRKLFPEVFVYSDRYDDDYDWDGQQEPYQIRYINAYTRLVNMVDDLFNKVLDDPNIDIIKKRLYFTAVFLYADYCEVSDNASCSYEPINLNYDNFSCFLNGAGSCEESLTDESSPLIPIAIYAGITKEDINGMKDLEEYFDRLYTWAEENPDKLTVVDIDHFKINFEERPTCPMICSE